MEELGELTNNGNGPVRLFLGGGYSAASASRRDDQTHAVCTLRQTRTWGCEDCASSLFRVLAGLERAGPALDWHDAYACRVINLLYAAER